MPAAPITLAIDTAVTLVVEQSPAVGVKLMVSVVGLLATIDATGTALRGASEILAGTKDLGLDLWAGVHAGKSR